jgi:cytoskeletal protein CcmA (bactofilin family)
MPSRFRAGALLVFAAAFIVSSAIPATAAETAASELVIVAEGDVITEDLYAAASRVIIDGTLDGDLIAFAADEVVIRGVVTGSVTAFAPTVSVEGEIGGSLRTTGTDVLVAGSVGRDVVAVAFGVDLEADSVVAGDVLVWALNLTLKGTVGGTVSGTQRSANVEGVVEGDIDISVNQLTLTGPLQVNGDLGYRSDSEAIGLDHATVDGAVVKKTPLPPNIRVRALNFLSRILVALLLTGSAMLIAWGWPERTERAGSKARERLLKSYGFGAAVVFSPIVLAVAAGLMVGLAPATASIPLLAVFLPVIAALGGIVLALALVAGVPAVLMIGQVFPGDRGMYGAIAVGAAVVGVGWLVPFVSWLVPVLVLPLGMGAWVLGWREPTPE